MRKIFILTFSLSFLVSFSQTVFNENDFPVIGDTADVYTFEIVPTENFSSATTEAEAQALDTLEVHRTLQKALENLSLNDLATIINNGGEQIWEIPVFNFSSNDTWVKAWSEINGYIPGNSDYPNATMYYYRELDGKDTYNYYRKDATGFYEQGSRNNTDSYSIINTPEKPIAYFPLQYQSGFNDYSGQTNTINVSGVEQTSYFIDLDGSVDAFGTLKLVTGTPSSPIITQYDDCIRTKDIDTTHMVSSSSGTDFNFYIKSIIYKWYAPNIPEPVAILSVAQVRNDVDPSLWAYVEGIEWHDELDFQYEIMRENTTTAINKVYNNTVFELYPNPATNNLHIKINNTQLNNNVKIFDVTGTIVAQFNLGSVDNNIDISKLEKGIYFVRINNNTEELIIK